MLIQLLVAVLLFPATLNCLTVLVPTLAGLFPRRRHSGRPTHAFAVLIPAHNEQLTLPASLQSLAVLDYPPELVRVFVVADHCTDHTATVARWGGAVCLVRAGAEKSGKGYAIQFGLEKFDREMPDIVLILDASCRLHPNALLELDAKFSLGADAVQCSVRNQLTDEAPAGFVAALKAALDDGRVRGLERLGFSVPLRGTGMAFRRALLHRITRTGGSTDEYSRSLRKAHAQVKYCGEAIVWCESARGSQQSIWNRSANALASRAMSLAYLAAASTASIALGLTIWPVALLIFTTLIYVRAAWQVRMERKRKRSKVRSPGMVVELSESSRLRVLPREAISREAISRDNERQAA